MRKRKSSGYDMVVTMRKNEKSVLAHASQSCVSVFRLPSINRQPDSSIQITSDES